jgi:lipopolysaccharide export system protein LptA
MRPAATSLLILCLAATGPVLAKSTDRSQPMDIDADSTDALLGDDAVTTMNGNVRIRQGTLEVDADRAEIHRSGGDIGQIVLTGSPARLRQVSDQGEPLDARAQRIVYTRTSEIMLLTGGVVVEQPRGSLRGETLKYNLDTGRIEGGGDGQRVSLRILPKTAPAN